MHDQPRHRVRLEWGPTGGAAISAEAEVAVVVDVLSFTTSLSVAVSRGTRVQPFRWRDHRAREYADARGAVLAVGRLEARGLPEPVPSLSPAHLLACPKVDRLVLPSPNGSTICAALRAGSPDLQVVGAALRNRAAVAAWLSARLDEGVTVAVVPAGERWPDATLRPAVEDLWGAGAVLDALPASMAGLFGPEAKTAVAAYQAAGDDLRRALTDCASGQELVAMGFGEDVVVAAELDADDIVPVLTDDGFTAAQPG